MVIPPYVIRMHHQMRCLYHLPDLRLKASPWPILLMERAFACCREPSSANASSSKKKLTLLALSRKYWSVFFVCKHEMTASVKSHCLCTRQPSLCIDGFVRAQASCRPYVLDGQTQTMLSLPLNVAHMHVRMILCLVSTSV